MESPSGRPQIESTRLLETRVGGDGQNTPLAHLDSTIVAERAVVLTSCWATLRERLLQFLLESVFRHRMHPARTPQPSELTIDFP
jgi:hypothetical protein